MKKQYLIGFILIFFTSALFAQKNPVHWKYSTKKISNCEYDLVFSATIDEPWHVYAIAKPEKGAPNPTVISLDKSSNFELVGEMKESTPIKEFDVIFKVNIAYHKNTATFTQRIKILTENSFKITGKQDFQACTDEMCIFPPSDDFAFDLTGSADCTAKKKDIEVKTVPAKNLTDTATKSKATEVDKNTELEEKTDSVVPTKETTLTETKTAVTAIAAEDCNPWKTLLIGLLFGLGAVLMPCIYSLIPLTVSFFLKQSKTKISGIKNALLYGFFIILIFVVLTMGITVLFGPTALSNIATNTWLNLFFFALFVVFALSFFGLFEITLPSSWANKIDAKSDKGGAIGIFFMALTLVIVSFSCTVGFMGSLLTAVASGDSYLCPLMGFTGFGAGIALPFMLFAFFPSWLGTLPKSGGWMTTFKVTVAFLELALAVKFLANADNVNEWGFITREVFIALWIGIFAMLFLYLIGVFRTSHDDNKSHLSIGRIIWATFFLAFTIYLIPGMWGAPLKLISSFPPPPHYAESPDGFGGSRNAQNKTEVENSVNPELTALENKRISGPEGLRIFKDDYESALKYAQMVNKPLFVDFTGLACVNCRLMESHVWVKPEVLKLLQNDVVIVSLYVDSKVDLPQSEQKEVFWYGKNRTLTSIGDKWAYLQTTKYNSSSQPLYVLLDSNEKTITNGTKGTELDEKVFAGWLSEGVAKFEK